MMAGNNNDKYGDDRQLAQHLWLGAIETVLNGFIELDPATRERVNALHGLVVRVKVIEPYLPFYLFFTREGIEVCDVAPSPARVRVNARLFDLMRTILGASTTSASGRPRVRVWGESESVAILEELITDFNLRTRAQQWLQSHLNLDSFWQKIRNHDPSWLQDFLPLPGMMKETLKELRSINQNLLKQQEAFERFQLYSQQQRNRDLIVTMLAFAVIVAGLTGGFSLSELAELSVERILFLLAGIVLVLSRLKS